MVIFLNALFVRFVTGGEKIWIYFHLAADFPLMDGYSEAVAGLFTICL